ncbi:TPMT family class I SAM-dependent methyltransferase [bacterium]|nr:TPMT family class I SAM-dependent methyltransferase [bacterium]
MNDEIKFWNDCYCDRKTGWDRGEVHSALLRWLEEEMLVPCDIVVPGCGRGYEVIELAQQGFQITAIDIANEPVQYLRKRLSRYEANARVIQRSIFDYRPDLAFDAGKSKGTRKSRGTQLISN